MMLPDKRRDELEKLAAVHHIYIIKTWQRLDGQWCIQLFFLYHPHPDGSGEYVTCRHHDLSEMYSDLTQYLTHVEDVDMNIFGTKLFKYLSGVMFLDKSGQPVTVNLTIADAVGKKVADGRGGEDVETVVSFIERDKLLILNKTNALAIIGLYGGETDDWRDQKIALTAEHGAWFGKKGVRVVVLDHLPANGGGKPRAKVEPQRETLTQEELDKARKEYRVEADKRDEEHEAKQKMVDTLWESDVDPATFGEMIEKATAGSPPLTAADVPWLNEQGDEEE